MESVLKKDNITCIIPFYNEDEWTLRIILYSLLGIPEITQIIVIDDGSESKKVYNSVVKAFTHRYPVKVIRLSPTDNAIAAYQHQYSIYRKSP